MTVHENATSAFRDLVSHALAGGTISSWIDESLSLSGFRCSGVRVWAFRSSSVNAGEFNNFFGGPVDQDRLNSIADSVNRFMRGELPIQEVLAIGSPWSYALAMRARPCQPQECCGLCLAAEVMES